MFSWNNIDHHLAGVIWPPPFLLCVWHSQAVGMDAHIVNPPSTGKQEPLQIPILPSLKELYHQHIYSYLSPHFVTANLLVTHREGEKEGVFRYRQHIFTPDV